MTWITDSRIALSRLPARSMTWGLVKFPSLMKASVKDTIVSLLCKELEKIPVPVIGTVLSKLLQKAAEQKTPGPSLEYVLQNFQAMRVSDEQFRNGLFQLGEDVDEIGESIKRIEDTLESVKSDTEETRKNLTASFRLLNPIFKKRYPQFDNELSFVLANAGGGAVMVPEISLFIEKWEPEIRVNYTTPMAPLMTVELKAVLSPAISEYALLTLNKEPQRRFGAYSEGAERFLIQMSSVTNARYFVRIRIPYTVLRSNQSDKREELLYPPIEDPPLEVSFPYAPGWSGSVTPENMQERGLVLTEILNTFDKITALIEPVTALENDKHLQEINRQLIAAGFDHDVRFLVNDLNNFLVPAAKMIKLENRKGAWEKVFRLAHLALRFSDGRGFNHHSVQELADQITNIEIRKTILAFFVEQNEKQREKMLDGIIAEID